MSEAQFGTYVNKFLVALATAVAVLVTVLDNGVTSVEWLTVGLAALGALGVYAVPNATKRPTDTVQVTTPEYREPTDTI